MAATAKTLLQMQDVKRDLYLFDIFEGISDPTSKDVYYSGKNASEFLQEDPAFRCADAPLEGVKNVLYDLGYTNAKINFVQSKVEVNIPVSAPYSISLLRLDIAGTSRPSTNWFTHRAFPKVGQ